MSLPLHADSTEANEVYVWHVLRYHLYEQAARHGGKRTVSASY